MRSRSDALRTDVDRADPRSDMEDRPSLDYEGPPVTAELEVMESDPPRYAVAIDVRVPTAGWQLELVETRDERDATVVKVQLTEPGEDEIVAQVVQTLEARATLDARPEVVHVLVSRWQRGVQYLVEPEAKLAAIVRP